MKVLHYSDHPEPNIKALFAEVDVLFTTGDLTYFDLVSIEKELVGKTAFGVYGNHCTPGYLTKFGIIDLHLKVFKWNGLLIGGYQGCPRYKDGGGPQFTEEEATRDLANFRGVDILLLHAAPYGLLDTPSDPVHTGSKAVREYVDKTQPKYIFCGHNSPSNTLRYGNMSIYRTHQSKIISIPLA